MLPVILSPQAQIELDNAAIYYQQCEQKLGERFALEFLSQSKLLGQFPEIGQSHLGKVRQKILKTFPYTIFYVTDEDKVYVVSLAHQKQEVNYWLDRL